MDERVLDFFKTFTDLNRLRLAALLSEERLSLEEIAARLRIKPGEVPRQLNRLEKLGLLRKEEERYSLNSKALEALSREVLAGQRQNVPEVEFDGADDFDRAVVRNYLLPDGRLKEIPTQYKKRVAVLRHVAQAFEPGVRYSEKQVNETLSRYHPDFAALRRYLFDLQIIDREPNGSAYWRREE